MRSPTIARPISLFLDVDGTLLEFASHPDAVVVGPSLVELLGDLHRASGGLLALVSGRSIDALDRLFAPFRGVAVGLHGLELRRDPDASPERSRTTPPPEALRRALELNAAAHRATLIEDKGAAIAIHHRLPAPAMQALRRALQQACDALAPQWTVLRGRQVLEIKPRSTTKGHGVDALMADAPFRGSVPVAFGDDVTDLDMFEAIHRHAGTAVAVGPRIAGSGDLQLDAPGESIVLLAELRDALAAGADAARIGRVLRSRAHA
ncbi:MAG: trehalose-phosphatase [Burkholderiaceae bacterium]|jgi:trehalose 6-phosphate phosphatase|nr:trehalose-phosphatase [Burkholderiales bacterium]MCZ8339097.1 trehalose-phosphatase [Burkholderiaceae bacterium]